MITKQKILTAFFWKLSESFSMQFVQLFVQILLARVIAPDDFGLMILTLVFIQIAVVVVQGGFNEALIQNKHSNNTDFSTVFYINLVVALSLYTFLFFLAPVLAQFFEQPQLTFVIRIVAITLFIAAVTSVQHAILSKRMQFKRQFVSSFVAILLSSAVAVYLAVAGYGIWALVVQTIVTQTVMMIMLFLLLDWYPQLVFSWQRAKKLFSFGWKLLLSSLLDVGYRNSRNLVIGKMYDSATLAYYNRGDQFPSLIVSNVNGSIQSVLFPSLSAHQDDLPKVTLIVRKSLQVSCFFIFPLMIGMGIAASSIIELVLTTNWAPAVPFMQMACVSYALWPIHTTNLQAINALGRSDLFLKLEIIKKLIGLAILLITIQFGVHMIAFGVVIGGFIGIFINAYPNKTLLHYGYKEQLFDVAPVAFISLLMGAVLLALQFLDFSAFWLLVVQIIVGVPLYIVLAYVFKIESLQYVMNLIQEKRGRLT